MNATQHAECYSEVQADIARMEAALAELRAVAKWHFSKANKNGTTEVDENGEPEKARRQRLTLTGQYTHMKQIVAAEEVLRAAGEPLHTRIIAQRLLEGGFQAKNLKKLIGSLFTGMTRKPDVFVKNGPGMWTLIQAKHTDGN